MKKKLLGGAIIALITVALDCVARIFWNWLIFGIGLEGGAYQIVCLFCEIVTVTAVVLLSLLVCSKYILKKELDKARTAVAVGIVAALCKVLGYAIEKLMISASIKGSGLVFILMARFELTVGGFNAALIYFSHFLVFAAVFGVSFFVLHESEK